MKLVFTLLLFSSHMALMAQATAEVDPYRLSPQGSVEIPASFPGGTKAMVDYINAKLRYPLKAKAEKRGGYSYIQFTIKADGTPTNFTVLRKEGIMFELAEHITELDEEALRVSKSIHRWIPAKNQGEQVEVEFIMSIKFTPDR